MVARAQGLSIHHNRRSGKSCLVYDIHVQTAVRAHVERSCIPNVQNARREKLRLLQEREAAKARMSRLQTMLQQKLVNKYGSKRLVSVCLLSSW